MGSLLGGAGALPAPEGGRAWLRSTSALVLAALLGLAPGCGREETSPAPAPTTQAAPTGPAEAATPAEAPTEAAKGPWPAPARSRWPGWPGWVTVPPRARAAGETRYDWSPGSTHGRVGILELEIARGTVTTPLRQAWEHVPAGAELVAISAEGRTPARFVGVREEPYGCDGVPLPLALFSTDGPFLEGLVWMAPPEQADRISGVPVLPLEAPDAEALAWEAGGVGLRFERTAPSTGHLSVTPPGGEPQIVTSVADEVQEAYADAGIEIDLERPETYPQPVAAFRFAGSDASSSSLVVLLATHSLEGVHFEALQVGGDGTVTVDRLAYAYLCAF